MKQGLSHLTILEIAKRRPFIVNRYGWQDASARKKIRRMIREGLLKIINENKHMFEVRASVAKSTQQPIQT